MALHLDGSILEGGGQILRNAFACACLMRRELVIDNIRGKRSPPGLRAQHTQGIVLVNNMCEGKLVGANIGSTSVHFEPSSLRGGQFSADTGTAGSVALLTQVSLPCMLFAPSECSGRFTGGTNADMAPQVDYIQRCLLPTLTQMGIEASLDIERRGYFPKGGGRVSMRAAPLKGNTIKPIELVERGEIVDITGYVVLSKLKHSIAERAIKQIKQELRSTCLKSVPVSIDILADDTSLDPGMGVLLVAKTSTGCLLAGDSLGKRGKATEEVAREAVAGLADIVASGACVDDYMQDQLIVFMALAAGRSSMLSRAPTLHTLTAMHIVSEITGARFTTETRGASALITCDGIGLVAQGSTAQPSAAAASS